MTGLDLWLAQATRNLAKDSAARVRSEIQQHYESALAAAIATGATTGDADVQALRDLGDARAANCRYREVMLTYAEARLLRQGNWEARAICSRTWLRWIFVAMPVSALTLAAVFFLRGSVPVARDLIVFGSAIGLWIAAPFLPIYTPARSRAFRSIKWSVLVGLFALAFSPQLLQWSWLFLSCLWPVAWIEWTRASIRRKLPVGQWPRQLYL